MLIGERHHLKIVAGLFALVVATTGRGFQDTDIKPAVPAPPLTWTAADYRFVPVRVHLLRAPETAAGTSLKTQDVERIFRKANGIWHAAGIHLWVESVVIEKPASLDGHEHDDVLPLDALPPLRPPASLSSSCFHIYYIHAMQPNGIFMRRDALFVKDTARLRPVPGGIDEPLPRVTAHELGHGMGLPHRQAETNLMASGTTGTSLNAMEIETARHTAAALTWTQTADAFLREADRLATEGKTDAARSRYRALLELPGASPLKDRAKTRLQSVK
jgi:hypothetical protein